MFLGGDIVNTVLGVAKELQWLLLLTSSRLIILSAILTISLQTLIEIVTLN
jgi:hypothetical protein